MSLSVRLGRLVVGMEPGQPVLETAEDFPGDGLAAFAPVAWGDFVVSVCQSFTLNNFLIGYTSEFKSCGVGSIYSVACSVIAN